jgi:hypothetical protein
VTTAAKQNQANSLLRALIIVILLLTIAGVALMYDGGLFFLVLTTYALGIALLSIWRIIASLFGVSDEDDLVAKRDIRFKIIEELKFDHNLGRISETDYEALYKPAAIDLLTAEKNVESEEKEHRGSIEAELEKRLRAEGISATTTEGAVESKPESKKKQREKAAKEDVKEKATTTATNTTPCPSCAKDIDPDSVFCKHCGHRMETGKAADA